MKNSILTLLAFAALVACNKKENTAATDSTADTTTMNPPADSPMTLNDSATVSGTSTGSTATLNDQDKKFADAAARGGMMEVMMGDLAAKTSTNASVKALGEMMSRDHGKANEELKKWASVSGYTLPTSLNAEQQKKYDELKTKKGTEFDKMYTDLMVSDHKKDIADFKKEASEGSEISLKGFASKTLPTLEHHLMEAEKAKAAVK
jgi:putative membrane protein